MIAPDEQVAIWQGSLCHQRTMCVNVTSVVKRFERFYINANPFAAQLESVNVTKRMADAKLDVKG